MRSKNSLNRESLASSRYHDQAMKNRGTICFCVLLLTIHVGHSAKILGIFSFPGASNFNFNEAILRSLYVAGHDITFLTTFADKIESSSNFTAIDSSGGIPNLVGDMSPSVLASFTFRERVKFLFQYEEQYCNQIMKLQVIQDALSSKVQFDVMFIQLLFMPQCYLKIAESLKIPVIGTVAFKQEIPVLNMGNPLNPSVVPSTFAAFNQRMSFVQRLTNTWYYLLVHFIDDTTIQPKVMKFCRRYFPELPGPPKIFPSLIFINSHSTLAPRPLVPNAVEIAGIHVRPAKALNTVLRKFINEAKHGVILFTFGSVVKPSELPPEVISAFVQAFASIPQRVIWKYEAALQDITDNVLLADWVPQRDILEHENVIAFISHCGHSGMLEAIYTGTPIVAAPMFADQPSNALFLQEAGAAVYLPAFTATKEQILHALNAIVNDTRYYNNMQELSRRFKDRPLTPEQSVVYWTEYIVRHKGADYMRTVAADMPLYQYLLLDVMLLVISVTVIILCVLYFVIRQICNFRSSAKSSTEVQKKEE